MKDESVRAALRSSLSFVLIEAPAGCGKTHQGADYAQDLAKSIGTGRLLILTHTHAAVSVFSERTKSSRSRVEIRTIDSLIVQIATIYHKGLSLPADIVSWVRQKNGYRLLALKVAQLLQKNPQIADVLVRRYPVIVCDEYQDTNNEQHAVIMILRSCGAKLRIFGDPMQKIIADKPIPGGSPSYCWDDLLPLADRVETLSVPHRWRLGCPSLGQWTLDARELLRAGDAVSLKRGLPSSVEVVYAINRSNTRMGYRLDPSARKDIDRFINTSKSLLVVTRHNETADCFRGFFNRRLPLWEGHTRTALEELVSNVDRHAGNAEAIAGAVSHFVSTVAKGLSASALGNKLQEEARQRCTKPRRGKSALIQELANYIVDEPDHRGVSKLLRQLWTFRSTEKAFQDVDIDRHKEYWEAIYLGDFDSGENGLREITRLRSHSHPKPPPKAISTIHKAKGLEFESVLIMPCSKRTFPENEEARCLLYVALSRAKKRLMLVVSPDDPSPLVST